MKGKQAIALVVFILVLVGIWYATTLLPKPSVDTNVSAPSSGSTIPVAGKGTFVIYDTVKLHTSDVSDVAYDTLTIYRLPIDGGTAVSIATEQIPDADIGVMHSEIFGQQILSHNYLIDGSKMQDALIGLDGSVTPQPANGNALSSRDGKTIVHWTFDQENSGGSTTMTVTDASGGTLATSTFDPDQLGLNGGEVVPTVVSDDGKTVYLIDEYGTDEVSQRLWSFDVSSGKLTEITAVALHHLVSYSIDPATEQLLGVTATAPTNVENVPAPPSVLGLMDLKTGIVETLQSTQDSVYNSVFLSPDNTRYAYSLGSDNGVWATAVGKQRMPFDLLVSGTALGWVDGTLIIDRDDRLILYTVGNGAVLDLGGQMDGPIDRDQQKIDYIGTITLN